MLGGYPRVVTEARITSKMVRCRWVSPGWRLSLLSLMGANVTAPADIFKHVFEVCRVRDLARNRTCRCPLIHIDQTFGHRTHDRLYSNTGAKDAGGRDAHDSDRW